jgi:hypothetical protein
MDSNVHTYNHNSSSIQYCTGIKSIFSHERNVFQRHEDKKQGEGDQQKEDAAAGR